MNDKLSYEEYYDKVLGGWVGKCAGGILGAPIEGYKHFNSIPYSDKLFETNFANDDLDLQVLWLDMILKKGKKVRGTDFNEHWRLHVDFPWCEYGIASRNIAVGLDNPNTGDHNNWYWNTGMGSPIRSEIWGMVNPGYPDRASFYAQIDSSLDHFGFSVEAEKFLSACAAVAFFEKDMKTILLKGLDHIETNGKCYTLIQQVIDWDAIYDYNIVMGKIKSLYGDADFTNAPMNIAFTVLSLLHTGNSFDFLIDALHLGHDSDCVVATAGALLGITLGYKAIPQKWKDRVGNELLVSPEIVNIDCPATLTELAELTCKAGIHFIKKDNLIESFPKNLVYSVPEKDHDISVRVTQFPKPFAPDPVHIIITYENQSQKEQVVLITLHSSLFSSQSHKKSVAPGSTINISTELTINWAAFDSNKNAIPYILELDIDSKKSLRLSKGLPYYGNWLLLGPFIQDDPTLIESSFKYPDHGMSSLPSVKYMNHDLARSKKSFLTTSSIQELIQSKTIFDQDFHTQIIHPEAMRVDLSNYFHGKGERTIYMYSEIDSPKDTMKWLTMGAVSYLTLWHNGECIYKNETLIRSHPLSHAAELHLKKGRNSILIRIDSTLDDFRIEVGLKDHDNKHPHQCLWNTMLQFDVMGSLTESL